MSQSKPFLIGLSGGSGSGKTTIASRLVQELGEDKVLCISHDNYYQDQSNLTPEDRAQTNYDHPDAYETTLLIKHLQALILGKTINQPIYDFAADIRGTGMLKTSTKPFIIVEGILIFEPTELRNLFDLKVFVDTDADIRIIRRLNRDLEMGLNYTYIVDKYLTQVRPMYLEFVEPYKKYADLILAEDGNSDASVQTILNRVRGIITS